MSRTVKWEHPSDSFHTNHRLERKARSAGRLVDVILQELDEVLGVPEVEPVRYEPAEEPSNEFWEDMYYFPNSPCGGTCRRCLIHGDPGGCVG